MKNNKQLLSMLLLAGALMFAALFSIHSTVDAGNGNQTSDSDVFWTWDASLVTGDSTLIRHSNRINANLHTSELPTDQAMTMWFIVFNYPEDCVAGPYNCGPADLGTNRAAQGDFLIATGHVVNGNGQATFAGSLAANDISGSGMPELPDGCVPGYPDCGDPAGLIDPSGALVVLAVHSHGPKQTGQVLASQLSSYLGGCEVVIGTIPGGFAAGPDEVPVEVGECSTIQMSPHAATP
ncbi:MAG: hypothetical protein M9918_24045 [Anaerolineae bacterium]|nr:hypothetical protein [Anaerolineae bacterium]